MQLQREWGDELGSGFTSGVKGMRRWAWMKIG
jgi:hypothetical protein